MCSLQLIVSFKLWQYFRNIFIEMELVIESMKTELFVNLIAAHCVF